MSDPADYERLAAIRDWRRVAHMSDQLDLVPGGDQPDCSGNGGGASQLFGGHG